LEWVIAISERISRQLKLMDYFRQVALVESHGDFIDYIAQIAELFLINRNAIGVVRINAHSSLAKIEI